MTDNVTPNADEIQQPPVAELTVTDLVHFAQIIQLSSSRGAFRAEELASVGTLYNKLFAFLDSVGAINKLADAGDLT